MIAETVPDFNDNFNVLEPLEVDFDFLFVDFFDLVAATFSFFGCFAFGSFGSFCFGSGLVVICDGLGNFNFNEVDEVDDGNNEKEFD